MSVDSQDSPAPIVVKPGPDYPYVYSRYLEPIAAVPLGVPVEIYTEDAFESHLHSSEQRPSEVLGKYLNPQSGPIFIEGAEPGDTLVVDIADVELTRDWAVSSHIPGFGGLTSTTFTRTLQDPLPEKVWIYRRQEDGRFSYTDKFSVEPHPFMGTMGTAPDLEVLSALTPSMHGGNMDVRDICAGRRTYFPVNVPGAYFYTGDCHAAQGDGEACGVALEITGKVTVIFGLIKGKTVTWPRIESAEDIMVVGSSRPMEDAARIAYAELVGWLVEDYGFDKWDAYQYISQCGKMYVGNMVDTYYSVVGGVRKPGPNPAQEILGLPPLN
ncbi:acetamidase/formamidase family protein [Actinacidiphila soli]|uniref:acetamidase/formamidase family protein n=1 Tax=Actinacidiphila soli TaxID=2487275 RepID=UPI000FC9A803|nr:acetamidase/formamidase family protein [Actinacidiphila soli]